MTFDEAFAHVLGHEVRRRQNAFFRQWVSQGAELGDILTDEGRQELKRKG